MGMRKSFLLSEEEKQQRKKRLEDRNLTAKRSLTSESGSSSSTSQPISNTEPLSPTFDDLDRVSFYFLLFVQNLCCNRN
jgi:hypothetical protein